MVTMAIPKEKLTAYERWEMSSFNEGSRSSGAPKLTPKALEPKQENLGSISDVLETIRREAYNKGMQEGYMVGMAKAREQAHVEREQLTHLANGFKQALEQADTAMAEDVLTLALDIAKAMLKTKLNVDTQALLPIVSEVLQHLPNTKLPVRFTVNHADAKILREYLAEELVNQDWQVIEDNHLDRGGCLVETAANQIDASNAVRWKRITEALSKHDEWLLP
jgi:flagellar assembly protein FliH